MSACERWNASSRGISHSDENDAKVVTLTTLRPRPTRIWRTVASSRSSTGATARSSVAPSLVISTWRVPRSEERRAELGLERADLATHGRLRQVQLLGGGAEVEQARHRLEGADRPDGQRTMTGSLHHALFMTVPHQSKVPMSLDRAP